MTGSKWYAAVIAATFLLPVQMAHANDWSTADYDLYSGDFDGNGRTDILYVAKAADKASGIALSDGSGPNIAHQSWASNYLGITWYGNHYKPIIGDYNGDNRDDVFMQRQTPGDHYLLLTQASGTQVNQLTAISQTVPNSHMSLIWSADQHVIKAGDFTGDGRSDLLLQGRGPLATHAIVGPATSGQFSGTPLQTWSEWFLGFQWSTTTSVLHVGDFNGDSRADLFIQARPGFAVVDLDQPYPAPAYRPDTYAILLAKTSGAIFQLSSIQQTWNHNHLGALWSPLNSHVLVGDFDGNGRDDLLLQSRRSSRPSYWLPADAAAQFTSIYTMAGNVTWDADTNRLIVANFDGGAVTGVYLQRHSTGSENQIAHVVTGTSVSLSTHVEESLATVVAGTAVGAIGGEFSVDESGAANYRIPIWTPPGVAGMKPELSLSYNSRAGNGLAGRGWMIGGLSAITRCGSTWELDGANDGVDFDSYDRFCLDGQRLIPLSGVLADYGNVGIEYRTEMQTFQRVVSVGGVSDDPARFTIYTKSGQVIDYGDYDSTIDSRIEAQGRTQALVWAVDRIRDRFDNFIQYTYDGDPLKSAYWPLTITYGNRNGDVVGRVEFIYDNRPDASSGYIAGSVVGTDKRLRQINVYARPNQTASGAGAATSGVRSYFLNYETSPVSAQSHLKSVIECDGPGGFSQKCLGATTVTWQHGYRGLSSEVTTTSTKVENTNALRPGDINGDGKLDFAFTLAFAFPYNATWRYRMDSITSGVVNTGIGARDQLKSLMMDWDNDGYQDIVQKGPGSNPNMEVIRGTATGLSTTVTSTTVPATWIATDATRVADFSGDGKQDILNGSSVRLNGSASMNNGTNIATYWPEPVNYGGWWTAWSKPYVVNFDGDGRDEFLIWGKECWLNMMDLVECDEYLRLVLFQFNPGTGQMEAIWWSSTWITIAPTKMIPLDVNGDSLSDVLSRENGVWVLRVATGNPASAYVNTWAASSITYTQYTDVYWYDFDAMQDGEPYTAETSVNVSLTQALLDEAEIFDYNKDGRTDVMIAHNGYWRVMIANGSGFDTRLLITERTATNPDSGTVIDENSDGIPDLLFASSSGYFRLHYGRGPSVTGVVERITDGLGAVTTIQYGVTSDPNVYKGHTPHIETGAQPVFPYAHLGAPVPVVTKFNSDNGRAGGVYTSYEYKGLKVHKQGRGLLGFSEVKAWNDASDIQTINSYFQTFPYTGMIATAEQRLPNTWQLVGDTSPDILLNFASSCDTSPVNCAPITPAAVTMTPGNLVTRTVNTVTHLNYTYGSKFPHVRLSEDWHYPLLTSGGAQPAAWKYSKTEYLNATGGSTAVYDDYGNPFRIKVTVNNAAGTAGDIHSVETQNYYTNDAINWILGRLITAKVTHTRPTYAGSGNLEDVSLFRVSSFAYDATKGVLLEETTEPASYTDPQSGSPTTNTNGANLWLKKAYEYDIFGNRKKETVAGADILTRISQVIFDGQGQFPVTVTNALNHGETQAWNTRYGVQSSVTGPNGLTTSWQYDSFGRRTMEMAPQPGIWTATDRYWCSSAIGCTDSRAVFAIRKLSSAGGYEWTEHDRLGRAVRGRKAMFDGREAYQDKYFDPLGREFLTSGAYFPGETQCYNFQKFDALGRVIEQWSPASEAGCASAPWDYNAATPSGGRTVHTQYDEIAAGGAGRITTVTTNLGDATARVMTKQTNVMDRLRFAKDMVGANPYATTEFDYDPVGNTSWVKDAAGNQTHIGYDVRGFKTSMNDPDMGAWTYSYDVLGQLKTQTDAKGQATDLGYDLLGRMTSRVEKVNGSTTETTTTWTYDDTVMGGPKAIGKLTKVVVDPNGSAGATGYEENYVYDGSFGYLTDVKRRINGEWHWISQTYDALGRLNVLKYPNSVSASSQASAGSDNDRLKIRHYYNALGYLEYVKDEPSGTTYWTAQAINSAGAITRELLGNGLTTLSTIDRATGTLEVLTTGPGVQATVQNLEFDWDRAANLKVRRDQQADKREEFDYDGLYRLIQIRLYSTVGGGTAAQTDNNTYDTIGNLSNKGGAVGAHTFSGYNYGTRTGCSDPVIRPHAVYQVNAAGTTRRYCYDGNGNVSAVSRTSGTGPILYDATSWWVANLARRISQGGTSAYSDFWYGPGRERIQQTAKKDAAVTETTLYVGGAYEKVTRGASTEHVHYIRGRDVVAIHKKTAGGPVETRYLHRDHLGSVVAATDWTGAVLERYSFDPWGKRRDPGTWLTPAPGTFSFDPSFNDRGYTGHEHIDHLGLVNMNGRVYDPELGRFLSADPFVQFPESTQGYNRYTYVGNNPLSYTDPSGFFSFNDFLKVVGVIVLIIAQQYEGALKLILELVAGFLMAGGQAISFGYSWGGAGAGSWNGGFGGGSGIRPPTGGLTPPINPVGLPPPLLAFRSSSSLDFVRKSVIEQIFDLFVTAASAKSVGDVSARTNSDNKGTNGAKTRSAANLYFNAQGLGSASGARYKYGTSDIYGISDQDLKQRLEALVVAAAKLVEFPQDPRTVYVSILIDDERIGSLQEAENARAKAENRKPGTVYGFVNTIDQTGTLEGVGLYSHQAIVLKSEVLNFPISRLTSILGHELVHVAQRIQYGESIGYGYEVEAYQWQIDSASAIGVSPAFLQQINHQLQYHLTKCRENPGCRY